MDSTDCERTGRPRDGGCLRFYQHRRVLLVPHRPGVLIIAVDGYKTRVQSPIAFTPQSPLENQQIRKRRRTTRGDARSVHPERRRNASERCFSDPSRLLVAAVLFARPPLSYESHEQGGSLVWPTRKRGCREEDSPSSGGGDSKKWCSWLHRSSVDVWSC